MPAGVQEGVGPFQDKRGSSSFPVAHAKVTGLTACFIQCCPALCGVVSDSARIRPPPSRPQDGARQRRKLSTDCSTASLQWLLACFRRPIDGTHGEKHPSHTVQHLRVALCSTFLAGNCQICPTQPRMKAPKRTCRQDLVPILEEPSKVSVEAPHSTVPSRRSRSKACPQKC